MLDDLKYIHQRDAQDALGMAEKQYQQLLADVVIEGDVPRGNVYNVVYAGVGGSALAADYVKTLFGMAEPFEIVRGYELPAYVDADTLVILASYSGDTEEILSVLDQAGQRGAQIAVITAGGKLWTIAESKHYLRIRLPEVLEPRFALFSIIKAALALLQATGVVRDDQSSAIVQAAVYVRQSLAAWLPTVPVAKNPAKQLAQEMIGASVVVYAGQKLYPAAYRWKTGFNENAKQLAWCSQLPEFNHNEFIGWTKQPVDKPYKVVDLRGSCEHASVQRSFELSERLLSGLRPAPHVVEAVGANHLEQLLWASVFGDFVTIYAALLAGINPTPLELVARLKTELDK